MKSPKEIYKDYTLMPTLSTHQLRVAAVAQFICENLPKNVDIDADNVILACLYHDMGNIIKFDLTYFPDFTKPEGVEYWQKIKDDYINKYGPDEHIATEMIAKEIGLPNTAFGYLHEIGFSKLVRTEADASLEKKICSYADLRVGPYGVISLEERLTDGRKRYAGRKQSIGSDNFEILAEALRSIEQQIFAVATIKPEDINDESIAPLLNGF